MHYEHRLIADDIGQEINLFADSNMNFVKGSYIPDEDVPF